MRCNGIIRIIALSTILSAMVAAAEQQATAYNLDSAHSRIGFSVGHLGISTVSGNFAEYEGALKYLPGESGFLEAEATIDVSSVDTGVQARDNHLRSEDFFLADEYPEITYRARAVDKRDGKWILAGTFTMRGISRELEIPLTVNGPVEDPWGGRRIGLNGKVVIDRRDYNVGSDKISDRLVGRDVTIEIDLQGIAVSEGE